MNDPTPLPFWLARLTHEFRTPLSSLNASLELLSDEAGQLSAQETRHLYDTMRLSVTALQALVDNLLNFSSLEVGHLTLQRHPILSSQALAEAIHIMQPLLNRREQTLTLTAPIPWPLIWADKHSLRHIWLNLLMNASQYSPQQQPIHLLLEVRGGWLWSAIADSGPGIRPEDQARIFQPFVRLAGQESNAEAQGTGLGLSLVKLLVERQHGQVGVEARPSGGALFWFTLPLVEEQAG